MSLIEMVLGEHEMKAGADGSATGVMTGTVTDTNDPLFLSRVRVRIPALDALDSQPWARVVQPAASMASGMYWIPNKDDEVLVAFEQGDLSAPYVLGCLWSAIMVPPLPGPFLGIRLLRSPAGNQVVFIEEPATITISTPTMEQAIMLSPAGIQIVAGTSVITMSEAGITLTGETITLTGAVQVAVTAPTVNVIGSAATTLGSGASPTVVAGTPISIA